ncbi:DUF4345 domain-containing protein [Sphingomonas sp.]|uniref:DUF4345 domain-containing protein n=1 Tax=Sphingomonas sp. TaxID=28214 RepID=UPI002CEDDC96|nr:DUF4345 domain-containing protein [Sphingomonas sp.]HTG39217.1 DUF4345 domain-containing protein [Sphingomonas sp.]
MNGRRRALQIAVALASLVPLSVATLSLMRGPGWLGQPLPSTDLDSHFRYLSGVFLALGIGFVTCIPNIERKGARFRLLGAMVVAGGVGRAWSLAQIGAPSTGHVAGLVMELGVVPALTLWQAVVAARCRAPTTTG